MTETLVETAVRVGDSSDAQAMGRGVRQSKNGARANAGGDRALWQEAYNEARGRGAGENSAWFYADQKLLYIRRDRDGIAIPGERDYAAYR